MPTGERKKILYINNKTGEVTEIEDIKEITSEAETEKDFYTINIYDEYEIIIKGSPKVHRIFQRIIYGDNNRRKMNHLPMYRKPAWGRRKKKK